MRYESESLRTSLSKYHSYRQVGVIETHDEEGLLAERRVVRLDVADLAESGRDWIVHKRGVYRGFKFWRQCKYERRRMRESVAHSRRCLSIERRSGGKHRPARICRSQIGHRALVVSVLLKEQVETRSVLRKKGVSTSAVCVNHAGQLPCAVPVNNVALGYGA